MKTDPYYKRTVHFDVFGKRLAFHIPHDVFSTERVDDGTKLLLEHLPASSPKTVLDMGCGYGALGLPVAAKFNKARVEMVDRDLLAVEWARANAKENRLENTKIFPSLGFRELPGDQRYDWILCNIPARIGRPFIHHLLEQGRGRLTPDGELRVVVINDLCSLLEELRQEHQWPLQEVTRGARHAIYVLTPGAAVTPTTSADDIYVRDTVEVGGLKLERPFDLGGDDPRRLTKGLPIFVEMLPKKAPVSVLCFRCGYGALPLIARKRWPEAYVWSTDRDLMATTFTRRNAQRLSLDGERLQVTEQPYLSAAVEKLSFDCILGELSPSAGEAVACAELEAMQRALTAQGQALILALEKNDHDWVRPWAARTRASVTPMVVREGYVLLRLVK